MSAPKTKTLFVGNIPYDATEDELRKTFSQVGAVANFRLVFDKETQQPKGFGFVDFVDADTAMKCIKEFSDIKFEGRALRVDLADLSMKGGGKGGGAGPMLALGDVGGTPSGPGGRPPPMHIPMPNLPPPSMAALRNPSGQGPKVIDTSGGTALAADMERAKAMLADVSSVHTEIAQTVAAMPAAQLQVCLGALQKLAHEAPEESRSMLQDHPQLCYALLHAQLLLGLSGDNKMPPSKEEVAKLNEQLIARRLAARQATRPAAPPPPAGGRQPPPPTTPRPAVRPGVVSGTNVMQPPPAPVKTTVAVTSLGIGSKASTAAPPAAPAAKRPRI